MKQADREKKKAWKAQQKQIAQKAFPLPDDSFKSLFRFVEESVDLNGCDHSRRYTLEWIQDHQELGENVIKWLEDTGGFCDCEVIFNSYDHWSQNK